MLVKLTIHLDGRGVVLHPHEPLHVDGIVAWAGSFRYPPDREPPGRNDEPEELPLPLMAESLNGHRVFRASALFPVDPVGIDRRFWRSRFRVEKAGAMKATVNQSTGEFRSYNNALEILICSQMVGWFEGDRRDVKKWLKRLRAIGHKRSMGYGKVIGVDLDETDEDRCIKWDGRAQRWLPHDKGLRFVRPRPPYWNAVGKVRCLAPGDQIP